MSLPLLQATLESYNPARMSDEDAFNLELLLELPAFQPVWDLVESKLEAFYQHLQSHPQYVFDGEKATEKPLPVTPQRKKKQTEASTKTDPKPLTMTFRVVNGLLVPIEA